ncbi:sulfate/molybdate ABC transporter ATP-binding protein [Actinopolyspora halophila]|uniref:sulfate/molybdate ABC transporter ATP-binding protein n=1 Tax=Actinopolyspora halophila TaxID=1850 RepID=UPI00037EA5A7|nr:ATP-binding cassette domain-containing protein [Actinopolyspora halophila]
MAEDGNPAPAGERHDTWSGGTRSGEDAPDGLSAELRVPRSTFTLDVDLRVPAGEVLAVLGPNGAGKSTLLSALTGSVLPERGRVRLRERTWLDTGRGIDLPTHRRSVGLLAQRAMLFPHLSALDNVAFGPRAAGARKSRARGTARDWLERLGLGELAGRAPARLSGGQAQRVALARALAADPDVLLLDEPLSALDVDAAPAMRGLLHRTLAAQRGPCVLVTHDVLDAVVLADRVLVLDEGGVVERGRTGDVLARPRTAFTARIAGLNLVAGRATERGVELAGGDFRGHVVEEVEPGVPAAATFSPAAVAVHRTRPEGSPRNVLAVRLVGIEPRGDAIRLRGEHGPSGSGVALAADVTPSAVAELGLGTGEEVFFAVKATEVAVHPVSDG